MMLTRLAPAQKISIFAPRYHDRTILIAKFRVGTHNLITFTKAASLPDEYYLSGKTITSCPLDSNGKIPCYVVPIDALQPFEGRYND